MCEQLDLDTKRQEIDHKLEHYRLMPEVIIENLFCHRIHTGYYHLTLLVLMSSIALAGFGVSNYWEAIPKIPFNQFQIGMAKFAVFISAFFIYLVLLLDDIYVKHLLRFSREHLLNSIESISDLKDFDKWLNRTFDFKLQLLSSIIFSIFIHIIWLAFGKTPLKVFGYGIMTSYFILNIFYGITFYLFFRYLIFIIFHLSRYEIKLYSTDPGNSEIIQQLYRNLSIGIYMNTLFSLVLTILFYVYIYNDIITDSRLRNPILIISTLVIWGFTVAMFFSIYNSLEKIIAKKKRNTIQKIREKIDLLHSQVHSQEDNIDDVEKLEYIKKLMEYHDKIYSTKNTFLNAQASVNYISTLVIPILNLGIAAIKLKIQL